MSQLITITSAQALTKEEREEVRKDVEAQLKGCDVRVLFLAPGLMLQHVPQLPFLSPFPTFPVAVAQTACESQGVGDRTVQHVDTDEQDEEPAGVLPPHVWLYRNMLTDLQALAPLGVDTTNGQYAVAIDQLTLSQYAVPHIKAQLEARLPLACPDVSGTRASLDHIAKQLQENNTQSDAG